jgi:hypothetical protein
MIDHAIIECGILKRLLRDHDFRCIAPRDQAAGPLRAKAKRAPLAVRITREGQAWLVLAGAHSWLHGDERGALDDAAWLSHNLGLPIRRDDPEGSA